ncbi:tetratricopeptide repeat protein [uncultured Paludibaculum sp.]|uniref:tetratricopeptide repeat protein n=1 Tax=uncultured Paludibaculum sp. TaxID=1765020 RepID=UPI002AAB2B68|nr:tetratricopeptide repeat protein [uncultured Paludibaculum sp.]
MQTRFVSLFVRCGLLAIGCAASGQTGGPDDQSYSSWAETMEEAQRLRESGLYEAAYRGFEKASSLSQVIPGRLNPRARSLESLASVSSTLGRPLEAEAHYKAAIRLWAAMGKPATVDLLQCQAELIRLYVQTGQAGRAGRLARRLAADSEGKLVAEAVVEGRVTIALAAAAELNNDLDRAESLCRKAVRIKEQSTGITPEEQSEARGQLGLILWKRGRRAAALQEARRATEILESVDRVHSLEYATALGNQAMMSAALNNDPHALEQMRQAIGVARSAVGTSHFLLARLLTNYSGLLKRAKRGEEAKAARREAEKIYENTLVQQSGRYGVDVADLWREANRQ